LLKVRAPALEPELVLRLCARGERPFLLDGASDADGLGRYSFAGCDPDDGMLWRPGDAGDPFRLLDEAQRRWSTGPVDTAWPIAVGYVTYDAAAARMAQMHGRTLEIDDDLGLAGVDFARYRAVWRLDRQTGEAEVLAHDGIAAERLLARLTREPIPLHPLRATPLQPIWSKTEYEARVQRILEHLRAGWAYQVNLAQRLVARVDASGALALYLALRKIAPAPLGAYLEAGGVAIVSNSPELLLRVSAELREGGFVALAETRPIKGTRPRDSDATADSAQQAALFDSDKDAAEHLMIVDLLRNDLGRCAAIGSVTVDGPRLLTLPTVHHLVSTVRARVEQASTAELLAAVLPGGSITGAPKLSAVEIIASLEERARGVYCGALGWLGAGRAMYLALPIRTGIVRGDELIVPVGGGIVMDSTPEGEWDETLVKARAFAAAIA
jgi:para-aminobenzoate synthetase component 1